MNDNYDGRQNDKTERTKWSTNQSRNERKNDSNIATKTQLRRKDGLEGGRHKDRDIQTESLHKY